MNINYTKFVDKSKIGDSDSTETFLKKIIA